MIELKVSVGERSYNICIAQKLLKSFGEKLHGLAKRGVFDADGGIAVVTDQNVWKIYGAAFGESMKKAGLGFTPVIIPPGENSKSIECLKTVYGVLAQMKLKRSGLVAAFGGGVPGDLAGFTASTWMRGVALVQMPTTLLAQVDASVGGKTAINLPAGKNLIGVFRQPAQVLIDTQLLETLPEREIRCGMAEIIKYGAIYSRPLFERLSQRVREKELPRIVAECCKIKAGFVERDELDEGERRLLNFGHSFGHAIEKLGGYERFSHGEAVAIGMVLATQVGENLGITEPGCTDVLKAALDAYNIRYTCPYSIVKLLPAMQLDKMDDGPWPQLILLKTIGEAIVYPVEPEKLRDALSRLNITEEPGDIA